MGLRLIKNMKSLIMAAGPGSRIPQFTKSIPKCLIKIANKPLIIRQIEILKKNKINDIAIIRGYKKNKINFKNIKYFENKNFSNNDQLDSLFCALDYFNDDILITFSDIIYDSKILTKIIKSSGSFILAVEKNWKTRYAKRYDHPTSQADKVVIKRNKVLEVGKKIPINKANGEFLGIFKISKNMCKNLGTYYKKIKKKQKTNKLQMHDFFNFLIKCNINIMPCYIKGRYMEIDTYNDYEIARNIFK